MPLSDQDFREAFKPLHIPSEYNMADPFKDKTVFTLAELGDAGAQEVSCQMQKHEPQIRLEEVDALLSELFNNGLIKGSEHNGIMRYNLSKITHANQGDVDPGLLAPGLD